MKAMQRTFKNERQTLELTRYGVRARSWRPWVDGGWYVERSAFVLWPWIRKGVWR